MYFYDDTVIPVLIITAIIIIIIEAILANEFQEVAHEKGFYSRKYFWLPFLLGVFGAMVVIALPDRNQRTHTRSQTARPKPDKDELPDL